MSDLSDLRIRQLIEARLIAWASTQDAALLVEVENVTFDPPSAMYLRGFNLPATQTGEFLEGGHTAYTGVYQVSICAPKGQGAGPAGLIAGALRALFPQTLRIVGDDGFVVTVTSPLRVPAGISDDTRYVIPTSFTYRSDVT